MMDPAVRPAWERWLAIAVVLAVVVGIVVAAWLYSTVAGG
jgi:hypothetical protein